MSPDPEREGSRPGMAGKRPVPPRGSDHPMCRAWSLADRGALVAGSIRERRSFRPVNARVWGCGFGRLFRLSRATWHPRGAADMTNQAVANAAWHCGGHVRGALRLLQVVIFRPAVFAPLGPWPGFPDLDAAAMASGNMITGDVLWIMPVWGRSVSSTDARPMRRLSPGTTTGSAPAPRISWPTTGSSWKARHVPCPSRDRPTGSHRHQRQTPVHFCTSVRKLHSRPSQRRMPSRLMRSR